MTQEIKQRIEQIKKGKVPAGYKKSKLGIVSSEWENTSFSTLFTTTSDFTEDNAKYPLYSLTIENGITAKTERYERSFLVKKNNSYKIMQPNDFAYNPMNIRFGAVARHKGTKAVSVSGYYDIFTTVNQSDLQFMDDFLSSDLMLTYYNKQSTGSLIEKKRVHFSQFLDFNLPLPPLSERKKIAEILSTQDKVIELQQKRIDELKKLKKAYLSKMFPQKGSNVPELRFKGFTGNWEQRKLGECFDERTERSAEGELISVTISEGIKKFAELGRHDNSSEDKSHYKRVEIGDIAYNSMRMWQGASGYSNYSGILSPAYTVCVPHVNVDSLFFSYMFKLPELIHTFEINSQGLTKDTWNLKFPAFSEIQIKAPKNLAEQQKIGSFFRTLDNIITLQSRKLDAEKLKKKSLMQLLLTGIVRVK